LFLVSTVDAETGNPAVKFVAAGHDPEWHLEIIDYRNKIAFTSDSVTSTYDYSVYGPTLIATSNTTTYMAVTTDHQMSVVVQEKFCQDRDNGKAHATTVTVWLDGKHFNGCGDAVHNNVVE
jgi:hypothetical protein